MSRQNLLEELVQVPGGDPFGKRGEDLIDGREQPAKGIWFECGSEEDRGPGQKRESPSEILFGLLAGRCVAFAKIPLIDEKEAGSSLSQGNPGDFGILFRDALDGIQ
jgi:hypothetical protein